MRKKKYRQGPLIKTMSDFSEHTDQGGWTYFRNKPLHPGWITGMPFRTLKKLVKGQSLRKAIPAKEGEKDGKHIQT